jgi:hypothetical protein
MTSDRLNPKFVSFEPDILELLSIEKFLSSFFLLENQRKNTSSVHLGVLK